jgi:hypothetical protein
MPASPLPKIIKGILKQREILLKKGESQKNALRCYQYIKNLKYQIEAYQSRWDEGGWKRFAQRNYPEIVYLIPENKSGLTIKRKLNESL